MPSIESLHTNDRKPQDSKSHPSAPSPRLHPEAGEIAAAYDALSTEYDSQLRPSFGIRAQLWQRMDDLFPAGSFVLDVTAGTGLDTQHLIERGVQMIAGDLSPQMLAQLQLKVPGVQTRILDFNQLDGENFGRPLDGIISTFAGLNTSSDLRSFGQAAARLLRRDGVLFIHLLNRWPAREIAGSLLHLKWREAAYRLTHADRMVNLAGLTVPHTLYSPLALYRHVFAPFFRLQRVEAQGLFSELRATNGSRMHTSERMLDRYFPFHSLGTFFSLEMIRR